MNEAPGTILYEVYWESDPIDSSKGRTMESILTQGCETNVNNEDPLYYPE